MLRALLLTSILSILAPVEGGGTFHIQGNGYSFTIREPEGWTIDFRSAAQLAHFVAHPEGVTWRDARVVTFARFIRRRSEETLESFLNQDLKKFEADCPFYEMDDVDLNVKGKEKFLAKELHCPGFRHEILAVARNQGFFVTFVLSAEDSDGLKAALPPFQELLSSFAWGAAERSH